MALNLDALKDEILAYLETQGFIVFHGLTRLPDELPCVYWNTYDRPDYRAFLETARAAGVKLIVFHARSFHAEAVDSALARLEECEMSREEKRSLERRLRQFRDYEGFTCAVELSFDYQARVYFFNLEAEWYGDYLELTDQIEAAMPEEEREDEGDSMGGYFSRN